MSKRAEEKALEFYPMKDYNKEPNYIHSCDSKMLDEVYREVFTLGYEQAEKDTIERVIEWVKHNGYLYANRVKEGDEYVGEFMEEPFVESLRKAMEDKK